MFTFTVGLVIGVALGLIVIGFIAVGSYERGLDAAFQQRAAWQVRSETRTPRRAAQPLPRTSPQQQIA